MRAENSRDTLIPSLLLLLVALIWGFGFIVTRWALGAGMQVSLLLTLRFIIPTVLMIPLLRQELAISTGGDLLYGAGAGALLYVAFWLQTTAAYYTTPSNSAFLTSTNVVMVPFISWIIFRRHPGLRAFVMASFCTVGAAVLSYSPGVGISFNKGDWMTLACAFTYALHIAYLGLSAERVRSAAVLNFFQLATTGLLSLGSFLLFGREGFTLEGLRGGLLPAVWLGLFSTGLCFFLQSWAQRRVAPARAAIALSSEGLFGALISIALGFERPSVYLAVGGAIILLSIVLVQVDFGAWIQKWRAKCGVAPFGTRCYKEEG